jgi:hypothetical protein
MGSWIQNLNFVPFIVNGLIKGEIEEPSGQYHGLICYESLICWGLNSNLEHFSCFYLYLGSCGESRLLISLCVWDRCDMADNDDDLGRSRRHGADDWGWSSTHRVLGGRTIGRSGNIVWGLYREQGDEERMFLGWASKPRSTSFPIWALKPAAPVWWFGPQNHHDGFLVYASKPSGQQFVGCAIKPTGGRHGTRVEI